MSDKGQFWPFDDSPRRLFSTSNRMPDHPVAWLELMLEIGIGL